VMIRGNPMVLGRVLVMFRCMTMMFGALFRHGVSSFFGFRNGPTRGRVYSRVVTAIWQTGFDRIAVPPGSSVRVVATWRTRRAQKHDEERPQ
jgi:hypothetical protein